MATHEATIHPFPAQGRTSLTTTMNPCKRNDAGMIDGLYFRVSSIPSAKKSSRRF
jgi:hypothetical protein